MKNLEIYSNGSDRPVTLYKNKSAIDETNYIKVDTVLGWIKMGRWKSLVDGVRDGSVDKGDLPCVTWTGYFSKGNRTENGLVEFSGFAPMDFDMKEHDDDDIVVQIEELKEDPHVYAVWRSASGKGVHALMKIHSREMYRDHY